MKRLMVIGIFLLLLVYPVSAITWTSASGCWTATDGTYNYVRINATGAGMWPVPSGVNAVDYVVVGGGGGGGSGQNGVDYSAGGGGGGGYINGTVYPVTPGGNLNYTVGGGGAGAAADGNCGTTGGPSYFGIFTIYGGGGGGGETCVGAGGGSGGGGSIGAGGIGIAGQGLAGGDGKTTTNSGGGGGGNRSVGGGAKAPNDVGGEGGQGTVNWLTGDPLPLACGGGGSGLTAGGLAGNASGMVCGGVGGFATNHGANAIINTGSGGGGTTRRSSYFAGDGSNGVIYIRYASSVVSFHANKTYGATPLPVYFNSVNSTIGVAPSTEWAFNWSFGDGGISTDSNTTHTYTTTGIYTVNLTINAAGTNTTLSRPAYIYAGYTGTPTAAFSANVTDGNRPMAVLFTDASTGGATQWNWSFGDGNYSVSQNPTFTYNIAGTYTVNLTASNALGNNTLVKTAYIVVHPVGFPQPDFEGAPTSGTPGLLVSFTDKSKYTNTTSLAYCWSFGDGTYSNTIGSVQHVYAYASVYDVNLTVTNAIGSAYKLKSQYITVSTNQNAQNTWWTPHTVKVTAFDSTYGNKLINVNVTAVFNETSMPDNWITDMYGIRDTPAAEMLNASLRLGGTTGSDGTLTFTMLGSIKYDIYLTSSDYGLSNYHLQAFPADSMLNLYVPTNAAATPVTGNSTYQALNQTRVYFYEPDINNVTMCIDYMDTSGATTSVTDIWKFTNNNTVMNTTTIIPGVSLNTACYTVRNVRGTTVWWGYNATRVV